MLAQAPLGSMATYHLGPSLRVRADLCTLLLLAPESGTWRLWDLPEDARLWLLPLGMVALCLSEMQVESPNSCARLSVAHAL